MSELFILYVGGGVVLLLPESALLETLGFHIPYSEGTQASPGGSLPPTEVVGTI